MTMTVLDAKADLAGSDHCRLPSTHASSHLIHVKEGPAHFTLTPSLRNQTRVPPTAARRRRVRRYQSGRPLQHVFWHGARYGTHPGIDDCSIPTSWAGVIEGAGWVLLKLGEQWETRHSCICLTPSYHQLCVQLGGGG